VLVPVKRGKRCAGPDSPIAPARQFETPQKQKPRASVAFVRRLSVAKNHPAPPVIFPGQAGQK
jgi:hypothetical protein